MPYTTEQLDLEAQRVLSDAEAINKGATYVQNHSNLKPQLMFNPLHIEEIRSKEGKSVSFTGEVYEGGGCRCTSTWSL